MKKTFFVLSFVFLTSLAYAQSTEGRYRYDAKDKVMVDTETGKVYGFVQLASEYVHTEIDYVNGTVRPLKVFRLEDDEKLENEFNQIKKSEPAVNWIQKVRKIITGWSRNL